MALLVWDLLYKHEARCSIPQTHKKSGIVARTYDLSTGDKETGFLGLAGQWVWVDEL